MPRAPDGGAVRGRVVRSISVRRVLRVEVCSGGQRFAGKLGISGITKAAAPDGEGVSTLLQEAGVFEHSCTIGAHCGFLILRNFSHLR